MRDRLPRRVIRSYSSPYSTTLLALLCNVAEFCYCKEALLGITLCLVVWKLGCWLVAANCGRNGVLVKFIDYSGLKSSFLSLMQQVSAEASSNEFESTFGLSLLLWNAVKRSGWKLSVELSSPLSRLSALFLIPRFASE